jgi:hypothetical protein
MTDSERHFIILKSRDDFKIEIKKIILDEYEFVQNVQFLNTKFRNPHLDKLMVKKLIDDKLKKLNLTFYNVDIYENEKSIDVSFGFEVGSTEYLHSVEVDLKKEMRNKRIDKILK